LGRKMTVTQGILEPATWQMACHVVAN